ncbi:putative ribonuclease H-like domain-containing protein, partial [Tanacetum coccineum]
GHKSSLAYDPKVERSARLRKKAVRQFSTNLDFASLKELFTEMSDEENPPNSPPQSMDSYYRLGNFEDPSPIIYPAADNGYVSNFNIQPNLIAILPMFRGYEEPYVHLREFFSIVDTYQVSNITKDGGSINSWSKMKSTFLDEFYSISKTVAIRNKIKSFCQIPGEQFYEAFSRLKELLRSCPHHDVPKWELVKVFYDGLDCHNQQFVMATIKAAGYTLTTAEELQLLIKISVRDEEIKIVIDQGLGSTSGIRACALRNFDLEVMEFESTQSNTTAKLPILKLDNGTATTKMSVHVTAEEKTNKKNDVKARSLLLMALPNEHQLTFSQYTDAKTMFAEIKTRFRGNEATKKTQKALLKQQYENFNASSTESLDSIFSRLQKLVSRLAILGVIITQEDLNSKFLIILPLEWNTHVVVWMNKAEIESMSIDDLYNNLKIVEQDVRKSIGAKTGDQNMAFMSAPSTSSTNNVNTANSNVSTASINGNTASSKDSTATLSDATVYAFLANQPTGSQLTYEDLEQIHNDDLEEMDLKWQLALLSMRVRKFYQRTRKKITINGSDIAGFDKSKVECFNCHKMGHFARKCRNPRNQDSRPKNHENWNMNQDNTRRNVNVEETSSKAMLAIDGVVFDWSDMAEEQIQTNMALMAFLDTEVYTDKSCSKSCMKQYETLKKQCDDLIVKLNDTEFKAATYKRGLATVEEQLVTFKKNKYEKVKQEKDGIDFKIEKFDNATKSLDKMLESQITDKSKKGIGYHAVAPPHPLSVNAPTKLDLSYSGLEEFREPEFNRYGPRETVLKSTTNYDTKSDTSEENTDDSLVHEQVSEEENISVESLPKVDKETVFHTIKKVEFVKPKNNEKPVKKSVRYAEMYISQRPRGNQRNWNGQKSNQLGSNFVMNNKACFVCGSFDHIQYNCPHQQRKRMVNGNNYNKVDYDYYVRTSNPSTHKNMTPTAVLMKSGIKSFSTARLVSTAKSVYTARPVYTAHPKPTVYSARPMTYFTNQA